MTSEQEKIEQQSQDAYAEKQKAKHEHAALRDQFACASLIGILANPETYRPVHAQSCTKLSYELADAMLKARQERDAD